MEKEITQNKIVLIIFLLALAVRLIYLFSFAQFPVIKDDLQYSMIAKNILDGKGFSYDSVNPTSARGPFYPLFLATTYAIFGYDYNAARILQAVIGALTCVLAYHIAKRVYNPKIALYASLIGGVYPSLVGYTGLLYSETLAAFLLSLTIFFYLVAFPSEKKKIDIGTYFADFSRFKEISGWQPRGSLEEGKKTIDFYRKYKKFYWD